MPTSKIAISGQIAVSFAFFRTPVGILLQFSVRFKSVYCTINHFVLACGVAFDAVHWHLVHNLVLFCAQCPLQAAGNFSAADGIDRSN